MVGIRSEINSIKLTVIIDRNPIGNCRKFTVGVFQFLYGRNTVGDIQHQTNGHLRSESDRKMVGGLRLFLIASFTVGIWSEIYGIQPTVISDRNPIVKWSEVYCLFSLINHNHINYVKNARKNSVHNVSSFTNIFWIIWASFKIKSAVTWFIVEPLASDWPGVGIYQGIPNGITSCWIHPEAIQPIRANLSQLLWIQMDVAKKCFYFCFNKRRS